MVFDSVEIAYSTGDSSANQSDCVSSKDDSNKFALAEKMKNATIMENTYVQM